MLFMDPYQFMKYTMYNLVFVMHMEFVSEGVVGANGCNWVPDVEA